MEGNINVKWLQRLHVLDQPAMTRDGQPTMMIFWGNGKIGIRFSFVIEAKSIVTRRQGGSISPGRSI